MLNTVSSDVLSVNKRPKEVWISEPSKSRRLSIIREFALTTSTHGLPSIARSRSKYNFIFWSVSCVAFIGIMLFFISQTIINYFQYPTQVSVSIGVERLQTFPAVSFCNYGYGRYDRLIGPFLNATNLFNITNINDKHVFNIQETLILYQFFEDKLNGGDSVDEYFFSLDMMLIGCSYNGEICTADDFISFVSSVYGLCFTFNAKTKGVNGSAVRHTTDNGGSGTLELRLYAQSQLYIPFYTEDVSAGIVAMIHDNTELPQINVAGFMLSPGRKHKLGYRKKMTFFLPPPYTECTNKIPLAMQAMFDQYAGADYAYSQDICYILCTQAYIYQQCGCVSPYQWTARAVVLPGTDKIIESSFCNSTSTCFSDATIKFSNTPSIQNEFCSNCTQECSTVDFLITPSSVAAPSIPFAYVTKSFVESTSVPLPADWATNWLTEVQNNYVSLQVVCESTQVESNTQEPAISAVDVLSNVGGQTGLWIGLSFLAIMELVEMLYRLFRYELQVIKQAIQEKIRRRNQLNIIQ